MMYHSRPERNGAENADSATLSVIPANAGIQGERYSQAGMDPGLRRDDGGI